MFDIIVVIVSYILISIVKKEPYYIYGLLTFFLPSYILIKLNIFNLSSKYKFLVFLIIAGFNYYLAFKKHD